MHTARSGDCLRYLRQSDADLRETIDAVTILVGPQVAVHEGGAARRVFPRGLDVRSVCQRCSVVRYWVMAD
jgi:hypothetical protein